MYCEYLQCWQRTNHLFCVYHQALCIIPGLQLHRNFITREEETALLTALDALPWRHEPLLKRRVQHYGYVYDYATKQLSLGPPLPNAVDFLLNRLMSRSLFYTRPNQIIVNEYMRKQGLSPHVDNSALFGPQIATLSLGTSCEMVFRKKGQRKVSLRLPPRSLLVLEGEARHRWTHEIQKKSIQNRRVSVTLRTTRLRITIY